MENRNCQNCKNNFTIESDDFNFYEKIQVPLPTFCQYCRAERRFAFRNERKLFKSTSAFDGANIFSLYPPSSNRKVVTDKEWFSDSWDPMDYGRDFDFSKDFFTQFFELEKEVPAYALNVERIVDSPYAANAATLKDCYLLFNSNNSEDCLYGNDFFLSKNCVDDSHVNSCEKCYECFWLQNCYKCYFTIMSVESHNLWFSRDCLGCSDCFGCTNLRKSSYCIFNKQYSKEEYFNILSEMRLDTRSGLKEANEKVRIFWKTQINKYYQGIQNLNSYGSYVSNSKNVTESYMVKGGEDVKYSQYASVAKIKDCFDYSIWGQNAQLCYETSVCGENVYNVKFCWDCWPNNKNLEYSVHLKSCTDCFGCVGLRNKQYCIFNKQYTKEEYFILRNRIIEHMNTKPYIDSRGLIYRYGEFFPIEFSPFGYNNSLAFQHFSKTKEDIMEMNYGWVEEESGKYTITKKIDEIPDSIQTVDESITKEILECSVCSKPFRIVNNEFTFLKNENLPIPVKCSECRYENRISDRFKIFLYDGQCMCSGLKDVTGQFNNTRKHTHGNTACVEKFRTGFNPKNKDIVYCESCYQQEVV